MIDVITQKSQLKYELKYNMWILSLCYAQCYSQQRKNHKNL